MIFWNLEKYFYQEYNKNSMIFLSIENNIMYICNHTGYIKLF